MWLPLGLPLHYLQAPREQKPKQKMGFILHEIHIQDFICRSSRLGVFYKIGILENFAKFTVKHPCQGLFFNKAAGVSYFNTYKFYNIFFLCLYIKNTKIWKCNITFNLERSCVLVASVEIKIHSLT